MVDKEVAIARLQSTLLRLSKEDLIKLLKSTYQAMRIKHGIPFERSDGHATTLNAQREPCAKGAKTPAARTKRRQNTGGKKTSDAAPDTESFRKVEQPTFRQIDRLADDLGDLHFSSLSYDSDDVAVSEHCLGDQESDMPQSHQVTSKSFGTPDSILSDRELAIQSLKEEMRQLVPPLDLSNISASAKEGYNLSDLISTQNDHIHSNHMNSTCNDTVEPSSFLNAENVGARYIDGLGTNAYHPPYNQTISHPRGLMPRSYGMAQYPGNWIPLTANPHYVRGPLLMHPPRLTRPGTADNFEYGEMYHMNTPGSVRRRTHSVHRL
ncbi:uncharacterized protein BBOV_IV007170 [Babesia bovis T2Bo]|uniref:Uncharacterized protein n=1 Tax=Babesia bovis TaxID=5865 RepID=A7ARA4_BABBO|nr:uncharacterized protein BBOV_IV007170 [Babesia bovis T2Bo]EDO07073.1 hypothetical protein BBOV_IV007170 [Babesia bovis T2Bo]|eukprot:XP_001610641.1 hypothetical protein [Babesia bovis T2Bo]